MCCPEIALRLRSLVAVGTACASFLTSGLLASAATLEAQAAVALRPSDARSPEAFNRITGVRELADGRVLVVDAGDARVVVIDFEGNQSRTIGRTGSGPGEYRSPARLFALAADSSLLTENGGRWFLMAGDSIVGTVRGDDAVMTRAFARMALGADATGGVLALSMAAASGAKPSPFDSVSLVRVSRVDGAARTLVTLRPLMSRRAAGAAEARAAAPGGAATKRYALPLDGTDHAAAFCDGWTAVIRRDPFGVEWFDAAGKLSARTAPQPLRKLTSADQAPLLRWMSSHTGWPPTTNVSAIAEWPTHAPRVVGDADNTLALANGMVLVHEPSTAARPRNDARVYARSGRVHTQLTLPAGYRVAGSGPGGFYIAVRQDDGAERLQRHPAWVASPSLVCAN